ncbi:MAG: glycosyltransferase [Salinivirgaceae bacterium]|jgi:glycosyltransferase involved in cell wall biosynthesis|nr:glycosyltransferase [Salinivirgaceae bacterium]
MYNIIFSTYACGPNKGSEIGLGWNWVYHLSNYVQLHVLTESEFKNDVERELNNWSQKFKPKFYFIEIDGGEKTRKMCWNQGDYRFYYFYRKWQKKALKKAEVILATNKIDVVHQFNMIGYREPGFLWKIPNVKFVWGPIGGFGGIGLKYLPSLGIKNGIFYFAKNAINFAQRFSPRVIKAMHRANLLLAANIDSLKVVQHFYKKPITLFNETGSNPINIKNTNLRTTNNKALVVLWVGKFVARKALNIALETMALVKDKPITLKIIGGGANVALYKNISTNLNLSQIEWLGEIDHDAVLNEMLNGEVLLFTSLDEGTPHVVLEALGCGLPILCHDICGQSTVVDESCGIKIKAISPQKSAYEFSKILLDLLSNKASLIELKKGAKQRSISLSWSNKISQIVSFYGQLLN